MIVSVLRKEARENLKGKWKKAILSNVMFYIIIILTSFLGLWIVDNTPYGLIASILNIIIAISLNYGLIATFIKLKRNEKVNIFHFMYFAIRDVEKVWKNIGRLFLKILIYVILLLFFAYLSLTEIVSLAYGNGMRLTFLIEMIGTIVLGILIVIKVLYYALMQYILCDNRQWKAKEILKESQRIMKKHRWDFIKLNLSFTGWLILGTAFSAGIIFLLKNIFNIVSVYTIYIVFIPLIFLLPYMYIATICFYDNLLYNNPRPKEEEATNKKTKKKNKKSK